MPKIEEKIAFSALTERCDYTLRFIANNYNSVTYQEQGQQAFSFIELCTMEVIALQDIRILINSDRQKQIAEIPEPVVWRYVLEDNQQIIRIMDPNDHSKDVLVQDMAASFRDEEWDRLFKPYWEAR